jgi:hypothetical protein
MSSLFNIKMKRICYLVLLLMIFAHCVHKENQSTFQFEGKPKVPTFLLQEHRMLLQEIDSIVLLHDKGDSASVKLAELMHHHFKEEEDYVLPPLGLLRALSQNKFPQNPEKVIEMTEKLRSQLDHMSAEHQLIKAFLNELKAQSGAVKRSGVADLESRIEKHAKSEEEVFFPTALLIGNYLAKGK